MRHAGLLFFCALLFLAGCSRDTTGKIFRYDIAGPVLNLDPQFATDTDARMILGNLMEGLLTMTPEGEIQPGVAQRYTASADGLTYTFFLREEARWSNGEPVTAADFVFAFRRMFSDNSPHVSLFASIAGAQEILYGGGDIAELGVRTRGNHTLIIELADTDPFFLEHLCDPAATPCNEAFFTQARGRYGLEISNVLENGPFTLYRWNNDSQLLLRPNEHYASLQPLVAGGVNLYIGRAAEEQFVNGNTDLAFLSQEAVDGLRGADTAAIEKTVWCIVFNQDHAVWGNPLLRQGLAHAVDHQLLGEQLPIGYAPTSVMVPGAIRIGGRPFREYGISSSPLGYDTQTARRLFDMGLEGLGRETLPSNSTIVIHEQALSDLGLSVVQQGWQRYLSAYINFVIETPSQIQSRFSSGEYQMLLIPITPASSDISSLLGVFTSDSSQNYFGYRSVVYDNLFMDAAAGTTIEEVAGRYARAETLLLNDAVVIPLFTETTYLATASGVEDLQVAPFGDRIRFHLARKSG